MRATDALVILEARSLKSKCRQGRLPPRVGGRVCSRPLSWHTMVAWCLWCSLAVDMSLPALPLSSGVLSLRVCVFTGCGIFCLENRLSASQMPWWDRQKKASPLPKGRNWREDAVSGPKQHPSPTGQVPLGSGPAVTVWRVLCALHPCTRLESRLRFTAGHSLKEPLSFLRRHNGQQWNGLGPPLRNKDRSLQPGSRRLVNSDSRHHVQGKQGWRKGFILIFYNQTS